MHSQWAVSALKIPPFLSLLLQTPLAWWLVGPIYASFLVTFGTIAGRHIFFANMARKIFGRFLPASLRPKIACPPALEKAAKGGGPGSV